MIIISYYIYDIVTLQSIHTIEFNISEKELKMTSKTKDTIVLQSGSLEELCAQPFKLKRGMKYQLQDIVMYKKRSGQTDASLNKLLVEQCQKLIDEHEKLMKENKTKP